MITQATLHKIVSYNKLTGVFTWALNKGSRGVIGCVAGYLDNSGYIQIQIDGVKFRAHRLAWIYCYGESPEEIDHINGERSDNRMVNLRSVSRSANMKNKSIYKNNISGFVGVNYNKNQKKWISRIKVDGKDIHIGSYKDKQDAVKARLKANDKYGFHDNHGRK
jgi:hypothetical protein